MTWPTFGTGRLNALACMLVLMSGLPGAWAGRPLASDDAGTAAVGTCQLESWIERANNDGAWVIAPACGIAEGLELGFDYTLPRQRDTLRAASGVALKWVAEDWRFDTRVGELNYGLKLGVAFERPSGAAWRKGETSALALATLAPGDAWALHANLGMARDHRSAATAVLLNLAGVWMPREDSLLFVETQANNRRTVFGGTVVSAGGRWWLIKDRLGLDLTASRESGSGSGTSWTLGMGWYGHGL